MECQKEAHTQEILELLEKCSMETVSGIKQLNSMLVGLSAAQLEYLIELTGLLFHKPFK